MGSKPSDEWCTPAKLTEAMGWFDLDPCSNERSCVRAGARIALPDDGLAVPWTGRVFVNPPYSDVLPWVNKACVSTHRGANVWMLLKLDPTTRWFTLLTSFSRVIVHAFRRRVAFERPDKPPLTAPFPSALVHLCPEETDRDRILLRAVHREYGLHAAWGVASGVAL